MQALDVMDTDLASMRSAEDIGIDPRSFDPVCRPELFCDVISHEFVLSTLHRVLDSRLPITLVTGPEGVGKTTVLNHFIRQHQASVEICRIKATQGCGVHNVLKPIASMINCDVIDPLITSKEAIALLFDELSRQAKRMLVIVDDAEHLPCTSLAALLHLMSFEQASTYVQLLIFGQPVCQENVEKLRDQYTSEAVSLKHITMKPLSFLDMQNYVTQRLLRSGSTLDVDTISAGVMKRLYAMSGGIPKMVHQAFHSDDFLCYLQQSLAADKDSAPERTSAVWYMLPIWSAVVVCIILLCSILWNKYAGILEFVQRIPSNTHIMPRGVWQHEHMLWKSQHAARDLLPLRKEPAQPPAAMDLSSADVQQVLISYKQPVEHEQSLSAVVPSVRSDQNSGHLLVSNQQGELHGQGVVVTPLSAKVPQNIVVASKVPDPAISMPHSAEQADALLPKNQYYVQLIAYTKMRPEIVMHHLKQAKSGAVIRTFYRKDQALHVVLMGPYVSHARAVRKITQLPRALRMLQPWVRQSNEINRKLANLG